jgi:transketolase
VKGDEDLLARRAIDTIRTLSIDAVERAKSGHPGTPMALAPLAYALWTRVMAYDPRDPGCPFRDRFVLSAGHASMLLYSALHLTGHDLSLEDLKAFRQWGSRTPGHPEAGHTPGVETTTGPLGQGFANAVGMALAERMLAARFDRPGHPVVDHRTWVVASDGDLMEGVASEAASLAGHWGLSRLCVFYDDNRITIDGPTSRSFTEDVGRRFEAYGWNVLHVPDTATVDDLVAAADAARAETRRPTLVVLRTHIGIGSGRVDSPKAHGAPLGPVEARTAKRSYGWPEDAEFLVPDDVARHMREAGARAAARTEERRRRFEAYRGAHPADAQALTDRLAGRLPPDADAGLDAIGADGKPVSTRKASGAAIQALAARLPSLVGGSADLAGSNVTTIVDGGDVQRDAFGGRNLPFGVREHAMGAILNGLALHGGWRPFGGTFLVFSDYMRPSMRLAALMRRKTRLIVRVALLVEVAVAYAVENDHETGDGHHEQHRRCQRIDQHAHVQRVHPLRQPGNGRFDVGRVAMFAFSGRRCFGGMLRGGGRFGRMLNGCRRFLGFVRSALRDDIPEDDLRQHKRDRNRPDRDGVTQPIVLAREQHDREERQQRQQRNQPDKID